MIELRPLTIIALMLLSFGAICETADIVDRLQIVLSGSNLKIDQENLDLRKVEADLTRFEHVIHKVPMSDIASSTFLYAMQKYPIRFIKANDEPFRSFDITFDPRSAAYSVIDITIDNMHIDNDSTVQDIKQILKMHNINYSYRDNGNMEVIDSSEADFIIEQAIFFDTKLYTIELRIR